jgi:hypothetical protein
MPPLAASLTNKQQEVLRDYGVLNQLEAPNALKVISV